MVDFGLKKKGKKIADSEGRVGGTVLRDGREAIIIGTKGSLACYEIL